MKLKLNIQRFSSTNATTHYELSQYIGSDKPTYLVDYNQDMSKIDTAIYGADAQATQNANNIGTMSNLNTTEKSSLVGAINEVNTQVGTNTTAIGNLTTETSSNTGNIGTMTNLTTTEKSNLVGAVNEINSNVNNNTANIGTMNNLTTDTKASLVGAVNEVDGLIKKLNLSHFKQYTNTSEITVTGITTSSLQLNVATNNDGDVFKIYGYFEGRTTANSNSIVIQNTGISLDEAITISGLGNNAVFNSSNFIENLYGLSITIATNGDITITGIGSADNKLHRLFIYPCLLFGPDFGDTPIQ